MIDRFAGALVLALLGAACTGSGSEPDPSAPTELTCSTFTACGGDPVGEWAVQEPCLDEPPGCPGASVDVSAVLASGRFTFNADKTYSADVILDGTMSFTRPLSCLPHNASCAESGNDKVTCTVVGEACKCDAPAMSSGPESGTWATEKTVLAVGSTTAEYCVSGDVLIMRSRREGRSIVLTRVQP